MASFPATIEDSSNIVTIQHKDKTFYLTGIKVIKADKIKKLLD